MKFLKFLELIKYSNKNRFHSSAIYLSELKNPIKKSEKPIKTNAKSEIKINKDVSKYFSEDERHEVLKIFPEKLLKKKLKTPETFYISDRNIAKDIAEYITKNLVNNVPFIEVNPGPGFLTQELLKTNIEYLRLFESNEHFLPSLSNLQKEHSTRISLKKADFINIWKLAFLDKTDNGNRIGELLTGLRRHEWNDGPNSRIFACVGSVNFFKHLINSIALQTSLFTYGRPELYLILPPPLYIHLTCSNDAGYLLYRATTILFQIMFEHEFLTQFKRLNFLPWQYDYDLSKKSKLAKVNSIHPDYLYLVKITPRRNLYKLCSNDNLTALWYFVKQHCISRKNRIIPTLEKWIPGSGPRLIINSEPQKGVRPLRLKEFNENYPPLSTRSTTMSTKDFYKSINIFTQFGDLSPSQTLTLFHIFQNWPEYTQSSFLPSMESSLIKMETIDEIDDDDTDIILEKHKQRKTDEKNIE